VRQHTVVVQHSIFAQCIYNTYEIAGCSSRTDIWQIIQTRGTCGGSVARRDPAFTERGVRGIDVEGIYCLDNTLGFVVACQGEGVACAAVEVLVGTIYQEEKEGGTVDRKQADHTRSQLFCVVINFQQL
jgi:hypothetical protein